MILRNATLKYKGYDPSTLTKGSHKRVCCSCDLCGRVRYVKYNQYRKLCKSCSYKFGKDAHNWRGGKVTLICQYCKKEYIKMVCLKNTSKFCSKKCMGKWQSENVIGENSPTWNGGSIILICKYCNKEYKKQKYYRDTSKFCSKRCQSKWRSENLISENSPTWKGGITNNPYCSKFNEQLKEKIRNKYNRRCFICGKPESENLTKSGKQRKLSVHHIDRNKQQGCNNNDWCLIPVCLKHHNYLHTNLWEARIKYLINYFK